MAPQADRRPQGATDGVAGTVGWTERPPGERACPPGSSAFRHIPAHSGVFRRIPGHSSTFRFLGSQSRIGLGSPRPLTASGRMAPAGRSHRLSPCPPPLMGEWLEPARPRMTEEARGRHKSSGRTAFRGWGGAPQSWGVQSPRPSETQGFSVPEAPRGLAGAAVLTPEEGTPLRLRVRVSEPGPRSMRLLPESGRGLWASVCLSPALRALPGRLLTGRHPGWRLPQGQAGPCPGAQAEQGAVCPRDLVRKHQAPAETVTGGSTRLTASVTR